MGCDLICSVVSMGRNIIHSGVYTHLHFILNSGMHGSDEDVKQSSFSAANLPL